MSELLSNTIAILLIIALTLTSAVYIYDTVKNPGSYENHYKTTCDQITDRKGITACDAVEVTEFIIKNSSIIQVIECGKG